MGKHQLVGIIPFVLVAAAFSQTSKDAIPAEKDQAAALQNLKNLYKELYLKQTPAGQLALAHKLYDTALETKDDAVSRFVMYREARDAAAGAGDAKLSVLAAESLSINYEIDYVTAMRPVLERLARVSTTPAQAAELINLCRKVGERAIDAWKLDAAANCATIAQSAAARVSDAGVTAGARNVQTWLSNLANAAAQNAKTEAELKKNPEDLGLNFSVGTYYAMTRGDFSRGLPFLAKGSDPVIKLLASSELNAPDAAGTLKIADGWWTVGDNRQETQKYSIHAHAAALYKIVVADLTGLSAVRAKSRIDAAQAESLDVLPKQIDLLAAADVSLKTVSGTWALNQHTLTNSGKGREMLNLAYTPPAEYDATVEFSRLSGDEDINVVLTAGGSTFMFMTGGWHNSTIGFDVVDGKRADSLPTSVKGKDLIPLKARTVINIKVRANKIEADVGGKNKISIATDYKNWALDRDWEAGAKMKIGLATQNSAVSFTVFRLTNITGQGKAE